jgi:hypothetical protein
MPTMTSDDIVGVHGDYGTFARMELAYAVENWHKFGVDYSPKVIAALALAILAVEAERDNCIRLLKRVASGTETAVIEIRLMDDIEAVLKP